MKKGQAANETAIMIGFMVMFLIAFLAVLGDRLSTATDDRTRQTLEEFTDVLEAELLLASSSQDGYSRMFTLPETLDGVAYSAQLLSKADTAANFSEIIVNISIFGNQHQSFRLLPDNIFGYITIGDNFVRKTNGIVNLTEPLG